MYCKIIYILLLYFLSYNLNFLNIAGYSPIPKNTTIKYLIKSNTNFLGKIAFKPTFKIINIASPITTLKILLTNFPSTEKLIYLPKFSSSYK